MPGYLTDMCQSSHVAISDINQASWVLIDGEGHIIETMNLSGTLGLCTFWWFVSCWLILLYCCVTVGNSPVLSIPLCLDWIFLQQALVVRVQHQRKFWVIVLSSHQHWLAFQWRKWKCRWYKLFLLAVSFFQDALFTHIMCMVSALEIALNKTSLQFSILSLVILYQSLCTYHDPVMAAINQRVPAAL